MDEPAVRTVDLARDFRRKRRAPRGGRRRASKWEVTKALDDVTLSIGKGELFGVLGPNGAGKTTLIKILCTLLLPTRGEAYVAGLDVTRDVVEVRKRINMVSGGETSGYGIMKVRENLWFFSQLYGVPSEEAKYRIDMLGEILGLAPKFDVKVSRISTGERQKMNLIRGFVSDPEVLFLDEPTLGLDVNAARQIRAFVASWVRDKREKTALLTTHYMAEADEMCDRVAIIDEGRILHCAPPHELKRLVQDDVVFTVRVRNPRGSPLDFVGQVKGVRSWSASRSIDGDQADLKIVLEDESDIADLMAALGERRVPVLSLGKSAPTLEDVFVKLVGHGLGSEDRVQPPMEVGR
ncbi:MAG TPA: ABC transporter ATP-binding protein [Candidatus Thermoplasmatota archaeon]